MTTCDTIVSLKQSGHVIRSFFLQPKVTLKWFVSQSRVDRVQFTSPMSTKINIYMYVYIYLKGNTECHVKIAPCPEHLFLL